MRRDSGTARFSTNLNLGDVSFEGPLTRATFAGAATPGNFGWVLRGTLRGMPVAVKFLVPRMGVSPAEALAAFFSEAANMLAVRNLILYGRSLDELGEPLFEACGIADESRRCRERHDLRGYCHLVFVHGVGEAHDLDLGLPASPVFFIVMEHLSGGTLADRSPLTLAEALRFTTDVALGLAALAAAHIVHADLHPGNVMFRSVSGEAVITDFGLSRISNGGVDEPLYSFGRSARGMALYFAPELFSATNTNTFASDV